MDGRPREGVYELNHDEGPAMKRQHGFTLIELMVALALGLILTGAVLSAFVANRAVYAATESLGRVQENARAAFELMARDIREAGGTPCNSTVLPVNVVKNFANYPYADFGGGIIGYDGAQAGVAAFGTTARARASGTDAVVLKSAGDGGFRVNPDNSENVNVGTYEPVPADWNNKIVIVCDPEHAAIFQITQIDNTGVKVQTNNSQVPGNSTNCLAPGGNCPNGSEKRYAFGCTDGWWKGGTAATSTKPQDCLKDGAPPAVIAQLRSVGWYVGKGTKAGNSLYRRVDGAGGTADEVAEHVRSFELEYLLDNGYVAASAVPASGDWSRVRAVRIAIIFEGEDRSGTTGGQALARRVTTTVAIRNRLL